LLVASERQCNSTTSYGFAHHGDKHVRSGCSDDQAVYQARMAFVLACVCVRVAAESVRMAVPGEELEQNEHLDRLRALEDAANAQPIRVSPFAHAFSLDFDGLPSIAVVVKAPDAQDADTFPVLDARLFLATRAVRKLKDGFCAIIGERPASGANLLGLGAVPPVRLEEVVRRLIEMVNIMGAVNIVHGTILPWMLLRDDPNDPLSVRLFGAGVPPSLLRLVEPVAPLGFPADIPAVDARGVDVFCVGTVVGTCAVPDGHPRWNLWDRTVRDWANQDAEVRVRTWAPISNEWMGLAQRGGNEHERAIQAMQQEVNNARDAMAAAEAARDAMQHEVRMAREAMEAALQRERVAMEAALQREPAAHEAMEAAQQGQPAAHEAMGAAQQGQPAAHEAMEAAQQRERAAREAMEAAQQGQPVAREAMEAAQQGQPAAREAMEAAQQRERVARKRARRMLQVAGVVLVALVAIAYGRFPVVANSLVCGSGGELMVGLSSSYCQCFSGFTGTTCETNMDDCMSSPCPKGWLCSDGVESFACACAIGYTGASCESKIDECASSPCRNGGVCRIGVGSHVCSCTVGYTGLNCETNIDECVSLPCRNGGVCTDAVGTHECTCASGYTGKMCEVNIDECVSSPCWNGGMCFDGVASRVCVCRDGFAGVSCQHRPFISQWDTTALSNGSSSSNQIRLPLEQSGTYDFEIDWGDGVSEHITSHAQGLHTYASPGVYTIHITGTIIGWRFNNSGDRMKIRVVSQWGSLRVGNGGHYFHGAENLVVNAVDSLNLTETTDLAFMFAGCVSMMGQFAGWDVSRVTNMESMFEGASTFLQALGAWNMSRVTNVRNMFARAGPVHVSMIRWCDSVPRLCTKMAWDTTRTSDGSSANNQIRLPLEAGGTYNFVVEWGDGTSETITSSGQGLHTYTAAGQYTIRITGTLVGWRFNNGGDRLKLLDVMQWGTMRLGNNGSYFWGASNMVMSAVDTPDLAGTTNMESMFRSASSFNSPIGGWDVSSVTNMNSMFNGASSFNQPIGGWDVSSVTDIGGMFYHASSFNQPIGGWVVSSVRNMQGIFWGARSFNQDISRWCVSRIASNPGEFDSNTSSSWTTARKPVWGTCPSR
jgi:surface protein